MTRDRVDLILDRLSDLGGDIEEVRSLAAATNGRVRRLELWQARLQGASWAVGRVPAIVASLAALASIVAVAVALAS